MRVSPDCLRTRACLYCVLMNPQNISNSSSVAALLEPGAEPRFTVALVYEDFASGRRGKLLFDKLTRELDDECEFDLETWSFNVLTIEEANVLDQAQEQSMKLIERAGLQSHLHQPGWGRLRLEFDQPVELPS